MCLDLWGCSLHLSVPGAQRTRQCLDLWGCSLHLSVPGAQRTRQCLDLWGCSLHLSVPGARRTRQCLDLWGCSLHLSVPGAQRTRHWSPSCRHVPATACWGRLTGQWKRPCRPSSAALSMIHQADWTVLVSKERQAEEDDDDDPLVSARRCCAVQINLTAAEVKHLNRKHCCTPIRYWYVIKTSFK